jgi:elongation factor Tu
MAKEMLVRGKPHLTVGTIGALGHGKSTLTAALTAIMAKTHGGQRTDYDELKRMADSTEGIARSAPRVQYQSANRLYTHVDGPGGSDSAKTLITGVAQLDAAVLVVSAPDGPTTETREHLFLARQVGVRHLVVFLNKADLVDDEDLDLAKLEVRELLSALGYPADQVPVVIGSALKALERDASSIGVPAVIRLVEEMDRCIPLPKRDVDKPFLMAVEDVFVISGRGTVATGQIERGTVKIGDEVEIVGLRGTVKTTIVGVEMFRKLLDEGRAGDSVGLILRDIKREQIERGQILCKPGSVLAESQFEAEVYMLNTGDGGRHTPFFKGYRPQFYFRTADVAGAVELPPGVEMVMPGDTVTLTVNLVAPVALEEGLRFSIREGSKTVGAGVVASIGELDAMTPAAPKGAPESAVPHRSPPHEPLGLEFALPDFGDGSPAESGDDAPQDVAPPTVWVDNSSASKVSLLFVTTRQPSDDPEEIFSGERADPPYFGKANVRIPEVRRLGEIPLPFEIKLFSVTLYKQTADPRKHFILQGCELLEKSDWLEVIRSSGNQEALIFVHGFNVHFIDAVFRCAQIAWDIAYKGIPILFSWASRGALLDYGYDRNSALIARSRFVDLLVLLRNTGIEKVHVLAHSMGNFAVLDALATHDHIGRPLGLGEVLMAAPDVDLDQYKDIAPKVRAAAQGMTLYASSMDRAMVVSKKLAGNIPRAGDVLDGGPVLIDRVDAIDVTAVGDDVFGLNHGVFATEKSILNDVKLLLSRGIRPPGDRLAEIRGMPQGQSPSKWWRYVR